MPNTQPESVDVEQSPVPLNSAEVASNQPGEGTRAVLLASEPIRPGSDETSLVVLPTVPCAKFVVVSISSALTASITSFIIADDYARDRSNSAPLAVAAAVASLLLLGIAIRIARSFRTTGSSETLIWRRKLIYRSVFFAALFILIAAAVGNGIGTSGAETARLLSDVDEMARIGDRISKARTGAARTVPAQVEMYKSIEPDVDQLTTTLGRLQTEYAIYDGKFPAQHEAIEKAIESVRIGARRMDLLRQQIAMAKLIENVDADAQLAAWEAQMQPILDREDQLDSTK